MNKYFIILFVIAITAFVSCNDNDKHVVTYQPKEINDDGIKDTLIRTNKFLLAKDKERIESFILRKNWNMKTSSTGLWSEIYYKTDNEKLVAGNIITINYRIELLNGDLCYSSDSTGSKNIKLGKSGEISGLEEALLQMRIGEKARFIMPPYMAMGVLGDRNKIPGRSSLVYDIEVIKKVDF